MSRVKALTLESLNPNILRTKYAVRGEIAVRAEKIKNDLAQRTGSYPFNTVISAELGNPQHLGQKPITFFRQVLSLMEYPEILHKDRTKEALQLFPADALARARSLYEHITSLGAYSVSQGIMQIRQHVADFIELRDGYPASLQDIFLTNGASQGVSYILQMCISGPDSAVIIPIPQYPLYSATIALLGGHQAGYYLNEEKGWSLDLEDIKTQFNVCTEQLKSVRAIVVINPGNPTGAVLPQKDIENVLEFCQEHHILCMADEVYQANIFHPDKLPFVSFKRVLRSLQEQNRCLDVELVSFHSISKGMIGECGQRGGYFEMVGIDPAVKEQIYKLASINLCPSVVGQILVDLMVHPPQKGDESYDQYRSEMDNILTTLHNRASALYSAFKNMEGVECQEAKGAMYLFPKLHLPLKAIQAARKSNMAPDEYYCMRLLERAGIVTVSGTGFKQREGENHFRTTFLSPGKDAAERLVKFHKEFMDEHR